MKKTALAVLLGAVVASGCTVRVADMTVGSTKNYNLNSAQFVKGPRVTGEDSVPVILFPLGVPNLKTAMDKAIEKDKCAVGLSDVVISQLNHSFIVGTIGARVEGSLIIDASQPGCTNRIQGARAPEAVMPAPLASSLQTVGGGAGGLSREQQLNDLTRTPGLSYEEYQRRYKIIMGLQ